MLKRGLLFGILGLLVAASVATAQISSTLVGATPGEFAVGDDGSASYTIPIQIPPGTNGMVPSIALAYGSQRGNGPVGVGWGIQGFSSITRCNLETSTDGPGWIAVTLTTSDALCLDGSRLVHISGTIGEAGAQYRTQKEIFSKITAMGAAGGQAANGPDWFEVRTKDGKILEYGRSTGAKVYSGIAPQVIGWQISEIRDRLGNYYTVSYTGGPNQVLPLRADYTGHKSGPTLEPFASVRFVYDTTRTDRETHYEFGNSYTLTHRLDKIETYTKDAQQQDKLVRRYELEYNESPTTSRSRLIWIQECGTDASGNANQCVPPTSFGWTTPLATNWNTSATTLTVPWDEDSYGFNHTLWFPGDFDGDGIDDLVSIQRPSSGNVTIKRFEATGAGPTFPNNPTATQTFATNSPRQDIWKAGDINGDGRIDLVWFQWLNSPTTGSSWDVYTLLSQSDGTFAVPPNKSFRDGNLVPSGNTEVSPPPFAPALPFPWNSVPGHIPEIRNSWFEIADVNGDGLGDLIHDTTSNWNTTPSPTPRQHCVSVHLANSSGTHQFSNTVCDGSDYIGPGTSNQDSTPQGAATDLNRDGRAEYVLFTPTPLCGTVPCNYQTHVQVWTAYDGGSGLFGTGFLLSPGYAITEPIASFTYYPSSPFSSVPPRYQPALMDLNGDNAPDLVYGGVWSGGGVMEMKYRRGLGNLAFASTVETESTFPNWQYKWLGADTNLDGRSEPVRFYHSAGKTYFRPVIINGELTSFNFTSAMSSAGESDQSIDLKDRHFVLDLGSGVPYVITVEKSGANTGARVTRASGPDLDLVSVVDDGLGDWVDIYYTPLPTVHTPGTTSTYPLQDAQLPLYVVDEHQQSNVPHAPFRFTYAYEGLTYEHKGRGFVGFKERAFTDQTSGKETRIVYRRDFPLDGMAERREVRLADNTLVELEINYFTGCRVTPSGSQTCQEYSEGILAPPSGPTGQDRYYAFADETIRQTYEPTTPGNSVLAIEERATRSVNANNDPISVTVYRKTGTEQPFSETTETQYTDNVSDWLIGMPTQQTTTHAAPGLTSVIRRTDFTADQATGLLLTRKQDANSTNYWLLESYGYDVFGNRNSIAISGGSAASGTDIAARTTASDFGTDGRLLERRTNALNHVEEWDYDYRFGVPTERRGPVLAAQIATTLIKGTAQLDPLGRIVLETLPGAGSTTVFRESYTCNEATRYDCLSYFQSPPGQYVKIATHRVRTLTEGRPASVTYYDARGREVRREITGFDGKPIYVDRQYDARGRSQRVSQPYAVDPATGYQLLPGAAIYWTENIYDELDRPKETRYPDHTTQSPSRTLVSYAVVSGIGCAGGTVSGVEATLTNQANRVRREIKDARGSIVCAIEELGSQARFAYDSAGLLLTAWDSYSNVVQSNVYARPGPGFLVERTDADMGTWNYRHDALGQLLQQDDAKGQTAVLTYDLLGRTRTRSESEGLTMWTWDSAASGFGIGKLAAVSSPETTYLATYSYDSYGRPTTTTKRIGSGSYTSTQYWDSFGRVVKIEYPMFAATGFSVSYGYTTTTGYIEKVYDTATPTLIYWRANKVDQYGNITEETLGNSRKTQRVFDLARGLPRKILTGSLTVYDVQHLEYDWDKVGSLSRREDYLRTLEETFGYDALNRLTGVSFNGVGSQIIGYDAIGNITSKDNVSGSTWTYFSNRPHAVLSTGATTYQYDNNGNQTTALGTHSRTSKYKTYNKACDITRTTGANARAYFFYGPDRELILSVDSMGGDVTHTYVDDLFEFEDGYSGGPADAYHNYVRANGTLVATVSHYAGSGNYWKTEYHHSDHLGSTDTITSSGGAISKSQSYDAWGLRRDPTTWANPSPYLFDSDPFQSGGITLGFGGHKALDHLGLVHMGGRVYDPLLGRFTTPDPVVQFAASGQGWNAYAYTGNNPLSAMDPSGYSWKGFWKGVFKIWKKAWAILLPLIIGYLIPPLAPYVATMQFIASGIDIAADHGVQAAFVMMTTSIILSGGKIGAGVGGEGAAIANFVPRKAASVALGELAKRMVVNAVKGAVQGAATAAALGGNVIRGAYRGVGVGASGGFANGVRDQLGDLWPDSSVLSIDKARKILIDHNSSIIRTIQETLLNVRLEIDVLLSRIRGLKDASARLEDELMNPDKYHRGRLEQAGTNVLEGLSDPMGSHPEDYVSEIFYRMDANEGSIRRFEEVVARQRDLSVTLEGRLRDLESKNERLMSGEPISSIYP